MLAALLPGASSYADTAIDQHIADGFQPYADAVAGLVFAAIDLGGYAVPWVLFWVIAAGGVCTIYFPFITLRGQRQGLTHRRQRPLEIGWGGQRHGLLRWSTRHGPDSTRGI